jgi:hypothetical protein
VISNPAHEGEIAGYANQTSFRQGEEINLHISTRSHKAKITVEFFRMGWYGGYGAISVYADSLLTGTSQGYWSVSEGRVDLSNGYEDSQTGLFDAKWEPSLNVLLDDSFPPGVYLVKLIEHDSGREAYIPFVIRSDNPEIIVNLPTNTWQAYNIWGGKSLYFAVYPGGQRDDSRGHQVSFNRPYDTGKMGSKEFGFLCGKFLMFDYPFLRWIEAQNYTNIGYCTDFDIHEDNINWQAVKLFISLGHDEYWTWQMRDVVERARDEGVSLAFLSGNSVFWQARLDSDAAGNLGRTLTCYKSSELDPLAGTNQVTDTWLAVGRPQSELTGLLFGGVVYPPQYRPMRMASADHWIFRGTSVTNGLEVPGIVGYEYDRAEEWAMPSKAEILARSPVYGERGDDFANMLIYEAESGAMVLSAGTMAYSWGLDDWGHEETGRFANRDLSRITSNFINRALV